MSGQIKLKLPSGGSKTIAAPDSAATETITLPAGTKTLATVENFTSTGIDDNATSTKLTTTSTGIDVTGTVTTDGIYLGGTGSANKLDDYEEGTWTPTSGTNSTVNSVDQSWYTKIGRFVHVQSYINVTTTSTSFTINGLPFTSLGYNPAFIYYSNTNPTYSFSNNTYTQANTTYIQCTVAGNFTNSAFMIGAVYIVS